MKKKNKILILFCVLLTSLTQKLYTQNAISPHSLAIWTGIGYSNLINHSPATHSRLGLGNSIGIGYEYNGKFGLLLQGGLEVSRYFSQMSHNDTLHIVDMINTEGNYFKGYYYFNTIKEKQKILNIGPSVMIGNKWPKGFYFLAGGKIIFNIAGTSKTTSDVIIKAYYEQLIGDNDDGMLSEMPNHSLTTLHRSGNKSLKINSLFISSIETGYSFFSEKWRRNKSDFRISLFCDFGFSHVSKSKINYDLIIDEPTTNEYRPYINNILFNNTDSQFLNSLFTGVKLTLVFGIPVKYECNCEW